MRVLIVDDFPGAVEVAGKLLRRLGHECWSTRSGAEALAVADTFKPELALLDIGLPGIDGFVVLNALRSWSAIRRPYLVAITGWTHALIPALQAGFDECVLKPAGLVQLLRAVDLAERRKLAVRAPIFPYTRPDFSG
ncbi:MAG TPA: response regulator [Kofleriaceae bacterium]|nr:response regulator [Kofleriaceae bacterium]